MSKLNLSHLQVGDIIKSVRTLEVVDVLDDCHVVFRDVQNSGLRFEVTIGEDCGSWRFEMVKKAAKPKPKVGDVITGKTLKATMWKRGTVVRDYSDCVLLLSADGVWISPGGYSYSFLDFADDEKLTVLNVA